MMISPASYCENVLKSTSAEQVKAEIRRLESDIRKMEQLARNESEETLGICPSVGVQLSCSKDYLKCARRALNNIIEYNKNITEENPD